MKIGIIITSNDPETVWNAFRFAEFAAKKGESVRVFLTGRGVEAEGVDSARFPTTGLMRSFVQTGGEIMACGTCLKLRLRDGTELYPLSNMNAMLEMIRESDKVLTF